jgi:type VI secretion system secreted protein VgrG
VEAPENPSEETSAWLRVAQPWAGKGFGVIFIPRTGDEVLVDFEEGDPDRPIVVGSVYNSRHKPPYVLVTNKTQSGIKTRSSKGGGPDNFNEIRFEDKKGHEELHIHAERTLSTVVEDSESRSVGGDRSTTIYHNENLTIKRGNRTETLEKGNDTLTLNKGNRATTLDEGNDSLTLTKGNRATTLGEGNDSLTLSKGNRTVTLDQGNDSLKATLGNITLEAPAGKYSASAKDVEITGTTSVKIVCGASSIEMTPATITIKSPTIEINGSALTTIKGAMVKINC